MASRLMQQNLKRTGFKDFDFVRVVRLLLVGSLLSVYAASPAVSAETHTFEAKAAGFILDGQSDVLANPSDSHDTLIFAAEIRGHTDKFVLKFRKPAS